MRSHGDRKKQYAAWSGYEGLWMANGLGLMMAAEAVQRDCQRITRFDPAKITERERLVFAAMQNRTAMLLYGLAIESMLKGLRVIEARHAGRSHVKESGKELEFQFASHKLVPLAEAARVQLTAPERRLLADLTDVVRWSGRYPVPTRSNVFRIKRGQFKPVAAARLADRLLSLFPGTGSTGLTEPTGKP